MKKVSTSVLRTTGLNERHRIIAEGGIPPLQYKFEREKWAMAERFGQYGLKSNVDIRKLWPTVEEIEEIKALRMYRKASEAQKIAEDKVVVEELRRKNRLAKIEENWKRHDEELAKYYDEKASAGDRQMEEEQELQRKVREVQEFFGYWVDPKDPRFDLMFAQREESAKLEEKLAKKDAKQSKR